MAQLHNGPWHCLKRDFKNGKMIELMVSTDVTKYYEVRIYKRQPNGTMKEDMKFETGNISDAKYKYNEYLRHL